MRHKSSGPFEGRIQGRAPPQRLCTVQEGRHRVREQRRAEARPQLLDLKAMFLEFPELCHFFVPKAFSVKTASLGGRLTLKGFLLNF